MSLTCRSCGAYVDTERVERLRSEWPDFAVAKEAERNEPNARWWSQTCPGCGDEYCDSGYSSLKTVITEVEP